MKPQQQAATIPEQVPVTVENLIRAESALYLGAVVRQDVYGKFECTRTPSLIEAQTVRQMNRDTLVWGRSVRARCRPGNDHFTRCRKTLHGNAADRRCPIHVPGCPWCGQPHFY